jgi:fructose-1,6-bisphosphatase/inositol monophosphatase family enzyme
MINRWEQDLKLALRLDDVSGQYFRQSMQIDFKPDNSPVTEVDLKIERCLRDIIEAECPDDKMIGEEFGQNENLPSLDKRMWVIDPIDHTRHFARGNPEYGTLIALNSRGSAFCRSYFRSQLGEEMVGDQRRRSMGKSAKDQGIIGSISKCSTSRDIWLS